MAGLFDLLSGIASSAISAIIPTSIYNPSTGAILGGVFGRTSTPTVPTVREVSNPAIPGASAAPLEVRPSTGGYLTPTMTAITEPAAIAGVTLGGAGMSIVPVVAGGLARLGGPALVRALPAIERVVAKAVTAYGGASLVQRIYAAYVQFRQAGHNHHRARRMAHQAAGFVFRRRRMRVTNTRALRRAIRRVRGFQRMARKAGALGVSHRGRPRIVHHRKKYYKRAGRYGDVPAFEGDVDPFIVEDTAEIYDEAEDLGYLDDEDVSEASGE